MKRLTIACLLTVGLGYNAHAADPREFMPIPVHPGTPTYWNWSGFYFGGQFGMTSGTFNPGNATSSMVAHMLRDTTIENEARISGLPRMHEVGTDGKSYGGFIGFNQQWEDVIIGLELNYSFGKLSAHSADSIGRSYVASDGYLYSVFLDSRASVALKDHGTLRLRGGYVMDRFLPYVLVGAAVGRADVSRSVSVALTARDVTNRPPLPPVAFADSASETKKNAFIYGFSAGVGLDVALMQNVFLRGEYEYVQFTSFKGMTLGMHTGRLGAGVKF